MKSFLLDLLFPKYCVGCKKIGSYICPRCFASIAFVEHFTCAVCNRGSIDGAVHPRCTSRFSIDGVLSGVVYKGIVKKLLYQFKYKPYLSDLKQTMSELFYEALIQNEVWYHLLKTQPIVTAIPLSSQKLRSRGYNHAALLAEDISLKFGLFYQKNILKRIKDTKPQFNLKREERRVNIKGAFAIDTESLQKIQGKTIIVVDDLATSFATLLECAQILKRHHAKEVWGITFAREE